MFELTINGKTYGFKFGIGFLKEINAQKVAEGEEIGFKNAVFNIATDGNPTYLFDVLNVANKGQSPRVPVKDLEQYIEEHEDLEGLCNTVLDFLRENSCTRKLMEAAEEIIKKLEEK